MNVEDMVNSKKIIQKSLIVQTSRTTSAIKPNLQWNLIKMFKIFERECINIKNEFMEQEWNTLVEGGIFHLLLILI